MTATRSTRARRTAGQQSAGSTEPQPAYRTLRRLVYPTSAEALRRLRGGERVPMAERANRRVAAGAVVRDIPEESVPWLLEQGLIERVDEERADG